MFAALRGLKRSETKEVEERHDTRFFEKPWNINEHRGQYREIRGDQ